jgi:hypothetical protein
MAESKVFCLLLHGAPLLWTTLKKKVMLCSSHGKKRSLQFVLRELSKLSSLLSSTKENVVNEEATFKHAAKLAELKTQRVLNSAELSAPQRRAERSLQDPSRAGPAECSLQDLSCTGLSLCSRFGHAVRKPFVFLLNCFIF